VIVCEDERNNCVADHTFPSVWAAEELRAMDFIYSNLLFERSSDFCLNSRDGESS
jgi:hypothetical protein